MHLLKNAPRRILLSTAVILLLAASTTLALGVRPSSAASTTSNAGIVVPLYTYPTDSTWSTVIQVHLIRRERRHELVDLVPPRRHLLRRVRRFEHLLLHAQHLRENTRDDLHDGQPGHHSRDQLLRDSQLLGHLGEPQLSLALHAILSHVGIFQSELRLPSLRGLAQHKLRGLLHPVRRLALHHERQ